MPRAKKLLIQEMSLDSFVYYRPEYHCVQVGSVNAMLGCPLANSFQVVHTIPYEVKGK